MSRELPTPCTGPLLVADEPDALAGGEWLVCPRCAVTLSRGSGQLRCSECASRWNESEGVADFVGEFPYWGEIPLDQMQQVLRDAATGSWRSALVNSQEPAVRQAAPMILNLDGANWHCLLPEAPRGRVLDVGAGMGANSHALARRYDEVVALEPVAERVEFMRYRFGQERLENVRIVRSSVWTLPFPKNSFDLVVLNGVLEWLPLGVDGDPAEVQLRALQSIRALLRPGGHLYVGIENRFAAGYFAGHKDPHCGLPWVTILPRPVAHWYARRKGLPGYRNYLYSSHGYRRLLNRAGLSGVDIYAALPSYNHPRYFIPLSGNLFEYHYRNHSSSASRLRRMAGLTLMRTRLLKYCECSFAIVARS